MILPIVALSIGFLILLVSLPLAYRKVPMNRVYGVRIEEAYKSDENWYEINALGGRSLTRWSVLIILTGVAGFAVPPQHTTIYSIVFTVVSLIAVLVPTVQILNWSDKKHSNH